MNVQILHPKDHNNSKNGSNTINWQYNLQQYDVIWNTPSKNQDGSMPIGNGEIGLNAWVDRRGRLFLLIARTDAWDEIGRLCKIGRICIQLTPALSSRFSLFGKFHQRLNLLEGCIEIATKRKGIDISIRIWIDANHPVVNIEVNASQPIGVQLTNEVWRTDQRSITIDEEAFPIARREPQLIYPDTILNRSDGLKTNQIGWLHANRDSIWELTLAHQGLSDFIKQGHDPLRQRIFGCIVQGTNMNATTSTLLQSFENKKQFRIHLVPFTEEPSQQKEWLNHTQEIITQNESQSTEIIFQNHKVWWSEFWDRSWLFASGNSDAEDLTRGYILQRWITACAGRGNYPIKFNGSLFTVDTDRKYDPDYRRWGPMYWFQNTRLPYWGMLMAGDFDLFQPLIKMFSNAIPLARFRSQVYFKHAGWSMPETMSFWGTYSNNNYGDNRTGMKPGDPTDNRYIRYHFNNSLEYLAMLLEYYSFTQDHSVWEQILPAAEEIFEWWSCHWPRDVHGKIDMTPANSVETYWDCRNPTPDIAGLQWTIDTILQETHEQVPNALRVKWTQFRKAIPEIPISKRDGENLIFPAYEPLPPRTNCENPELYAIFPFPIYSLTKPQLDLAQTTFRKRIQCNHVGWSQDEIQAALLGLHEDAQQMIVKRAHTKHVASRFPGFWGPNFDWIPDQDHGSNLVTAFQRMVAQGIGEKILLLPAWPKSWKVSFKLHLPQKTTVRGEYNGNDLIIHEITPLQREKDIQK